jgi:hypothetical protein
MSRLAVCVSQSMKLLCIHTALLLPDYSKIDDSKLSLRRESCVAWSLHVLRSSTQQKGNHWSDGRDCLLTFLKSFVALF